MAKQIVTQRESCLCDYGSADKCYQCELMKWPVAHAFLLAIFFFFFGINETVAMNGMIFLSALSCVFLFLASLLFFRNKTIALLSAFVLAITPVHILWSVTTSADISYAFFITLFLFFLSLTLHTKDEKIHILTLFVLTLVMQARPEGIILLLIYFLFQFFNRYNLTAMNKKYFLMLICIFLLSFPYFVHVFKELLTNPWDARNTEKLSVMHIPKNLWDNVKYFFEMYAFDPVYHIKQLYHPLGFTILAIVGLFYGLKKFRKQTLFLFLMFALIFLAYCSFYAGSVLWGVDVRYMLPLYPLFSIFVALGCESISKNFKINHSLFLLLLLCYFVFYIPSLTTPANKIEEAYSARLYHDFATNFAKRYPANCYFISHVTSIYSVLGKGHVQIWYVYKPEINEILKDKDCVIFDEGFWCEIKVDASKSCITLAENYELQPLESIIDEKRHVRYTFYKVIRKR